MVYHVVRQPAVRQQSPPNWKAILGWASLVFGLLASIKTLTD